MMVCTNTDIKYEKHEVNRSKKSCLTGNYVKPCCLTLNYSFLVIHGASAALASTFRCPSWCSFKIIAIPSQAHPFTNTNLCTLNNKFLFGMHI